jgi:hypothetical protein
VTEDPAIRFTISSPTVFRKILPDVLSLPRCNSSFKPWILICWCLPVSPDVSSRNSYLSVFLVQPCSFLVLDGGSSLCRRRRLAAKCRSPYRSFSAPNVSTTDSSLRTPSCSTSDSYFFWICLQIRGLHFYQASLNFGFQLVPDRSLSWTPPFLDWTPSLLCRPSSPFDRICLGLHLF